VAFGEVSGEQQSMLVFQEDNLDIKNTLGVEATGVLGSEIFNRFIVEVDYVQESVTLHEPESFKRPSGFYKMDMEVRDLRPFTRLKIKQRKSAPITLNLLIDTGTSSALFLDAENNQEIALPEKTIAHTVGKGLTGNINGRVGRTRKVKLGRFRLKNVVTSFPENWQIQKEVKGQKENLIRYGTVGSDVLSRFTAIYDYLNEHLYFTRQYEVQRPL
jgi:hypothetical protein